MKRNSPWRKQPERGRAGPADGGTRTRAWLRGFEGSVPGGIDNILGHAQVLVVVNLKGEIGARTARQRPQAGRGSECLAWSPGEGRCPRSVGQTHPKSGSRMGTRTSRLSRPSAGWRLLSSAQQMTFFKTRLRKKNEPL